MNIRSFKTTFFLAILHVAFASYGAEAAHDLQLTLDTANAHLRGIDQIALPEAVSGTVALGLDPRLKVRHVTANGLPQKFSQDAGRLRILLSARTQALTVDYDGSIDGANPPMVTPEATWLPGEDNWFPRLGENDTLRLTVITPVGQRAVLTGQLLGEEVGKERTRASFRAYADGPPTLFAGPYAVQERMHRGLRLRTYFHEKQTSLAAGYLNDVARQIDHFAAVIGPYPYEGFATVSASHPVGLGYPGLTYVSREILHLPFMRARSLPHEILHSWWGNAVGIAADSGNWAEGLTTYMADYGLTDATGRERMRRGWLRDYHALPPADDTALSRFKGKLHDRDQIVGHGKSAFLFHMLSQDIGVPAFNDGLARFYAAHRGRAAGWADLQAAFQAASGKDLAGFFEQWVHRAGAPQLRLDQVAFDDAAVHLTISQAGQPYALEVPVIIDTADGLERHVVSLNKAQQTLRIDTDASPRSLHVDPEHQLFRRLAAGESVPVVRDLSLLPAVQTVLVPMPEQTKSIARGLARRLLENEAELVAPAKWSSARPALIIGVGTPADIAGSLGLPVPQEPAGNGTAFVWTVQETSAPTVVVAAENAAALEALMRPLPRYRGESWLRFSGSQLVARGLWSAGKAGGLSAYRRPNATR